MQAGRGQQAGGAGRRVGIWAMQLLGGGDDGVQTA